MQNALTPNRLAFRNQNRVMHMLRKQVEQKLFKYSSIPKEAAKMAIY